MAWRTESSYAYTVEERVLASIISFLLVYVYLTLHLLLNNIFALLISLLALVLCYFYPYVVQLAVLIIFSVFAYIEPYAFHPSLSPSNIIINVIIPLSFIIISFINAVKYGTLSASISSSAVYLLLVNSKTFLPLSITGISLKDKFQSAVISSLPLVFYVLTSYYFIDASKPLSSFIIITILFITSSLLFSINKEFISLMGLVPAIVALYLMFGFSAQVIYSVVIAGVINFTPDIVNTYKRKKTVLHEIMSLKDANRKESQEIQESIELLKREIKANKEIFEKLNSYSQEVETLRNSNETEKDLKNLQEIQKRLSEISSSLNELVNDYMYNVIVGYNELTYKLKELGLLISTMEVTPQYKSLKDSINAYTNLKKEYESLLREATNKLNSLLRTYNLILSLKKYDEVSILDASAIDSVSDILLKDKGRIINDLSVCLGKVREFTSNLSEFKEINEKLISIDLYTSLNDKLVISSSTLSEFLNRLNSALHNVRVALLELFQQLSLSSLGVELNVIDIVETIFSKEEPYCAKVEELYSYKDPLLAAIQISEKKDALISLKQLIEDLDLINKLKENTCVDLKEFGIDPEFYAYVKDLVSKSISVELFENGSLCITSRA